MNFEQNMLASASSRRNFLRSGALLAALSIAPSAGYAALRSPSAPDFTGLKAALKAYVDQGKLASAIGHIGFGDMPAQSYAYGSLGKNDGRAVDRNSLWRVYSMTKPITGMAAMMLIDQGKMGLDQPIADFIPEFSEMQALIDPENSLESIPAERLITVRHLLTHSSGLGYGFLLKGPIADEYNRLGIAPAQVSKTPLPAMAQPAPVPPIDQFARRIASMPLVYQPGVKWNYSVSLDLLGYLIQLASGVEFETFLQQNLFDPLGMTSSYFQVPASETNRLADNHFVFGGALIPIDKGSDSIFAEKPAFAYGGGGLVCSAYDYDRFLQMCLGFGEVDGQRIMSEAAVRLGMRNLLPDGIDTSGSWIDGHGHGAGGRVGLGTPASPAGNYGWSGAAGTVGFVDTQRGFRASLLTQYMLADSYPLQRDFIKLVYQDLASQLGQAGE